MSTRHYDYLAPLSARGSAPVEEPAGTVRMPVAGHPFCAWLEPPIPAGVVGFVTPVYLDEPALSRARQVIRRLYDEDRLGAVFLRDLGLLSELEDMPRTDIVWDRWAWGRDYVVSRATMGWLVEHGVTSIEVVADRASGALRSDLETYGLNGIAFQSEMPRSFSPRCYSEKLTRQTCCGDKLCAEEPVKVFVGEENLLASGHVLTSPCTARYRQSSDWWSISTLATTMPDATRPPLHPEP